MKLYKVLFVKDIKVFTFKAWIKESIFYLTRKLKLHNKPFKTGYKIMEKIIEKIKKRIEFCKTEIETHLDSKSDSNVRFLEEIFQNIKEIYELIKLRSVMKNYIKLDLDLINKKYPNSFSKLTKWYIKMKFDHEICFCELQDFFDKWGIIIIINYLEDIKDKPSFSYHIYNQNNYFWSENFGKLLSRHKAEKLSIRKAFKILENKKEYNI